MFLEVALWLYDGRGPLGCFQFELHNSCLYQPWIPVLLLLLLHHLQFASVCHNVAKVAAMAALRVIALAVAALLFSHMHCCLCVVH